MNKTKVLTILLIAVFMLPVAAMAQEKLILKQGVKRATLKSGMYCIPFFQSTQNEKHRKQIEQVFYYKKDKSNLWVFDSLKGEELFLRKPIYLKDSLLTKAEYRQLNKEQKVLLNEDWQKLPNTFKKGKRAFHFQRIVYQQISCDINEVNSLLFAKSKSASSSKHSFYQGIIASGVLLTLPSVSISQFGFYMFSNPIGVMTGTAMAVGGSILSNRCKIKEYSLQEWGYRVK